MKNLEPILPISDKGLYPIRTVSEVTGVNSITLRAWERRYNLFQPKRSPKGHRLYSDKDIQRIQQVLKLLEKGISIGQVATALKESSIEVDSNNLHLAETKNKNVRKLTAEQLTKYQDDLLKRIRTFDISQLESFHHHLLSNYSIEPICKKLIIPVLSILDEDAKQQPSLTSEYNFYKTFILYGLGGLSLKTSVNNSGKKLLLLGITNLNSDVELLLFAMPLIKLGFQIVTLGCDVNLDSIPKTLQGSDAEGVLLYSNIENSHDISPETLTTIKNKIDCPIFISQQHSEEHEKQLQKVDVIVLPSNYNKQASLINKNINKSTK